MIRCSRSLTPFQYYHQLNDHVLDMKEEYPYLGILLYKLLSWSGHIVKITAKASQTFNFLRYNPSKCSSAVKTTSYLTLIRLIIQYASPVWDPHQLSDIQTLEKVQRRAAQWVMKDYNRYSSVFAMLHTLNWPSLQLCHRISRLQVFYKALYNLSGLYPFHHISYQHNVVLDIYHLHHYIIPSAQTNSYQHSFIHYQRVEPTTNLGDWSKQLRILFLTIIWHLLQFKLLPINLM